MKAFTDYLQPLLVSTLAVFAPIKSVLIVTFVLILCDMFSGILAALKRGEKISSAGLRRSVTKFLVYNMAIITGFLVEHYMLSMIFPISKLIAGLISVVELKSILENLNTVNGSDIFKSVLNQLGSKNDEIKKEVVEDLKKVTEDKSQS